MTMLRLMMGEKDGNKTPALVYLNPNAIVSVLQLGEGSVVSVNESGGDPYIVRETPEQVVALLFHATYYEAPYIDVSYLSKKFVR